MITLRHLVADLTTAVAEHDAANAIAKAAQEEHHRRLSVASTSNAERRKEKERAERLKLLDKHFAKHRTITRSELQTLLGGIAIRTAQSFIADEINQGTLEMVGTAKQAKLYAKVKREMKEAA